jgi:hypothetical protein
VIPDLLWRCPVCETDDALVQESRFLRRDVVRCRQCGSVWRVRRVSGDDFLLKLIEGPGASGEERPLASWYDAMKETVRLEPISPGQDLVLLPDEQLYAVSGPAELLAEETDPAFFQDAAASSPVRRDRRYVRGRVVGRGRLRLTSLRLLWERESGGTHPFPLERVNSVSVAYGLAVQAGVRLYVVRFAGESRLKWLTYVALAGRQFEQATGHRIATSHF